MIHSTLTDLFGAYYENQYQEHNLGYYPFVEIDGFNVKLTDAEGKEYIAKLDKSERLMEFLTQPHIDLILSAAATCDYFWKILFNGNFADIGGNPIPKQDVTDIN
jgi:hypothetical protein